MDTDSAYRDNLSHAERLADAANSISMDESTTAEATATAAVGQVYATAALAAAVKELAEATAKANR